MDVWTIDVLQDLVFTLSPSFILVSFMMTTVMSLLMWSAGLLLLSAVSHVRPQCDSSAAFMAHCSGITRRRCKFKNIIIILLYYISRSILMNHTN